MSELSKALWEIYEFTRNRAREEFCEALNLPKVN
jgi:hypothetical protein